MKQRYKRLAVLLVAVVMLATTASFTGTVAAESLSLDKECSLTVKTGKHTGLIGTDLFIDMIKIADAAEVSGSDTYAFAALDRYKGTLGTLFTMDQFDNADRDMLTQSIAAVALADDDWDESAGGNTIGSTITGLDTGLYLVVAHHEGDHRTQKGTRSDGSTYISTIYEMGTQIYTFTPVLVALPVRGADADAENPGEDASWFYKATINLKAEQDNRYGELVIEHTLVNYMPGRTATFVYQIDAVVDGESVYNDVVALSFDNPGVQSVTIGDAVPVGSFVTVTMVYAGASYVSTGGSDVQEVIVSDEGVTKVEFSGAANTKSMKSGGDGVNVTYTSAGIGWSVERTPLGSATVS